MWKNKNITADRTALPQHTDLKDFRTVEKETVTAHPAGGGGNSQNSLSYSFVCLLVFHFSTFDPSVSIKYLALAAHKRIMKANKSVMWPPLPPPIHE